MASPNLSKTQLLKTLEDLSRLALELKSSFILPSILLLNGELGAGKTALTKKIASHYGFAENFVKSPSYSLINIYKNDQVQINHLDFYRLNRHDQFLYNELEELALMPNALTIIEWPDRLNLKPLLAQAKQVLQVNLSLKNQDEITFRQIEIHDKSS